MLVHRSQKYVIKSSIKRNNLEHNLGDLEQGTILGRAKNHRGGHSGKFFTYIKRL